MAKPGRTGLVRIAYAFIYSMKGFRAGIAHEAAVRQELVLAAILTVVAFPLHASFTELLLLIILPWLTVTVELLNSAIEAVVDRIGPEIHELSGRAKDLGSAAVFVLLALDVLVWGASLGGALGLWSR